MSYKRFNFYCGGELYNELNMPKTGIYTETNLPVEAKSALIKTLDHSDWYYQIYYTINLPKGDVVRRSEQYTVTNISLVENGVTINNPLYGIGIPGEYIVLGFGSTIFNRPTNELNIVGNISRPYDDGNYSASELAAITATVTLSVEYTFYEMFIPQSDTESLEALDQLANNYIKNMNTLTVAFDSNNSNNLVATFTPLTDETLLDAVDDGKVTIRLQLMEHIPGLGIDQPYKPIRLITNTSYGNATNSASNPKAWARLRSHDSNYYGQTWLNLSKSQLQNGTATLTSVKNINYKGSTHGINPTEDDNNTAYSSLKVEMFCAALKRKYKDPFFYERGGYRKIATNWVEYSLWVVNYD